MSCRIQSVSTYDAFQTQVYTPRYYTTRGQSMAVVEMSDESKRDV